MSFNSFGLHTALLRGVEDLGFTVPTPIQRDAIPPAMIERDLLACAMTGSGKTAAFVLPILHRLLDQRRGTTRALVLTPTRELAAQIDDHVRLLARHTTITSAAVFGGVGMAPQERAFRTGADILVATPGRLLDHLSRPYARLDKLEYLVIDEADRMLDMGFLPDIRRVLKELPGKRQTFFFSATMPAPIAALAGEMLRNPVALNIERQSSPAIGITHAVYSVGQKMKPSLLVHLLQREEMESVVVFTRTKHGADRLANFIAKHGISCTRIHGNRSQPQRTLALSQFKEHAVRVLVATDIAARGIDVEALSHVVNFDVPHVADDYVHRVGRTARADLTGDAVTFVAPEEEADLRAIEKALGKRLPRLKAVDFDGESSAAASAQIPEIESLPTLPPDRSSRRGRGGDSGGRGQRAAADRRPTRETALWTEQNPNGGSPASRSNGGARTAVPAVRGRSDRGQNAEPARKPMPARPAAGGYGKQGSDQAYARRARTTNWSGRRSRSSAEV